MIVTISWHSTYTYASPVRQVHNELYMAPSTRPGQTLQAASLVTEPASRLFALTDAFGNTFHHFDLLGRVDAFTVRLSAVVETTGIASAEPEPTPALLHFYLQPTARSPFDPAIEALAREAAPAGSPPLVQAQGLLDLISSRFVYEAGHTAVESTAMHVLEIGRGVCQDFAHLMAAALRMSGVPTRYVSGFLAPSRGDAANEEGSHAWVQCYVDGAWFGFDPANQVLQDERYVVTAVGRDYDDVPPLRGSFRGAGQHEWVATVRVDSPAESQPLGQQQQQ
jgi:transglutaminase-like putative cysteine protease